jgi:hypothetical protein
MDRFIGRAVRFVGELAAFALVRGYVISVFWGWFVVPTLHFGRLGILGAIGIGLVASLFKEPIAKLI